MGFIDRLQHGWNAFMNKDPTHNYQSYGPGYSHRPDRPKLTRGNEKTIVTSVYNRIALDVASLNVRHCKLDENGRFIENVNSKLNQCLNVEANLDQTGRAFMQDVVMSMLDEGVVALVPIDTTIDPDKGSFDILSLRTGKILEWYPKHVKLQVYNEQTGNKEEIIMPKSKVGIVENPLFAVINEPNSTMQRLIRKLSLLDLVDEQSSAGKLDLIIQLPYVIKSEARREQAEKRRKDIEMQLAGSKYGIAYTDGTERITQLNRSLDNNLMKQIEYLTSMLFSQLGITQSILEGTADEQTMLNYNNRTIEPIISAIVDEMRRKFLTKTARTQMQTITFFRDPFKLVPIGNIAEIADKFTRNEIMTSNEIRQIVGLRPSDDPKADQLINSNLNHPEEQAAGAQPPMAEPEQPSMTEEEYKSQLQSLDELDAQLDDLEEGLDDKKSLKHYASPYYDPVKAHEYYMKNRELKGRKSTAGLNDDGKAAAKYVKDQLNAERQGKVQDHRELTDAKIEQLQAQKEISMEAHVESTQKEIESLRKQLKDMSFSDFTKKSEAIYKKIEDLRNSNATKRVELEEEYKSSRASARADHTDERKRLKEEYDEKYIQELDKIRSESKYKKVSTKKSKASSGTTTT